MMAMDMAAQVSLWAFAENCASLYAEIVRLQIQSSVYRTDIAPQGGSGQNSVHQAAES